MVCLWQPEFRILPGKCLHWFWNTSCFFFFIIPLIVPPFQTEPSSSYNYLFQQLTEDPNLILWGNLSSKKNSGMAVGANHISFTLHSTVNMFMERSLLYLCLDNAIPCMPCFSFGYPRDRLTEPNVYKFSMIMFNCFKIKNIFTKILQFYEKLEASIGQRLVFYSICFRWAEKLRLSY